MGKLIPAYKKMHAEGQFPGYSIEPYVPRIADLVRESGAKTLLDYGCGKGLQYRDKKWHEAWGIYPSCYDPAVSPFDLRPAGVYDGVICTDVLEHVPEDELEDVTKDLVRFSRLWCFVSVCCRKARRNRHKQLPHGGNVHVTIKPAEWWFDWLSDAFTDKADLIMAVTP